MKTTIAIAAMTFAAATCSFGQDDLNSYIAQIRQAYVSILGAPVSAIPLPGEVSSISGKPYSAVGRTVEYSPDGVHVDRSESNRVYRDDQGRTRRETGGGRIVSILDPVSGVGYSLQTESKAATRRQIAQPRQANAALRPQVVTPIHLKILNQQEKVLYETVGKLIGVNVLWDPEITPPVKNQFTIEFSNATPEQALNQVAAATKTYWKPISATTIYVTDDTPVKRAASPAQPQPEMSLVDAAREQAKRMSAGGRGRAGSAANVTVDDLGTQVVNGVTAQGVRTTSIIPIGTFGNDHDIKTVTERWVSQDLHVLVRSVYTDSRTGSTVYDLLNIVQAPPDPALFQVPAGYTVDETGGARGGRGGRGGAAPVPPIGR